MQTQITIPTIRLSDALHDDSVFIDVRSPGEYAQFHIDGAINIPLFSDEERAEVGTLYRQKGQEEAIQAGLAMLSHKLPQLYKQFRAIEQQYPQKRLVVYCWRGGMRSKGIVTVMAALGLAVVQLEGGIRSYRQWIVQGLEDEQALQKPFVVLSGNTGTGKTVILNNLAREGFPVIDLEALAGHRGSVFGHIGCSPRNQKQFEAALWETIRALHHPPYYVIEGESRRIGNISLPPLILEGKERGIHIQLEAPLDFRVKTICQTYPLNDHYDQFNEALAVIEKRLPKEIAMLIRHHLRKREAERVAELLLNYYYDPLYQHSLKKNGPPAFIVHMTSIEEGTLKVKQIIQQLIEEHHWYRCEASCENIQPVT